MKLHFKKNWIRKFDHNEPEITYGAGVALGKESTLSALGNSACDIDWQKFPIKKMAEYGWIKGKTKDLIRRPKDLLDDFFLPIGKMLPDIVLCRRTIHNNSSRTINKYALQAWCARILHKAEESEGFVEYDPQQMSDNLIYKISRLSKYKDGPIQAKELLRRNGIILIIERHLPKTYLDGAAMLNANSNPVIGMTLRFDRVDNFWFTLVHELVHIWKHLKNHNEWFLDDFEKEIDSTAAHKFEKEANKFTRNIFIPRSKWRRSEAYTLRNQESIIALSKELSIHPAIIAGRIQYEFNRYDILRDIVDAEKVRKHFRDVNWD